jgi:hypothetical protein
MISLTHTAAVKAAATLTATDQPDAGESLTIGSYIYTFVAALTAALQVKIQTTLALTLDALKAAINRDAGEGSLYGTGTPAHPTVEATTNSNTTQKLEARLPGAAANATPLAAAYADASLDHATLTAGADATDVVTAAAAADGAWTDITGLADHWKFELQVLALTAGKTARLTLEDATDAQGTAAQAVATIALTGQVEPGAERTYTISAPDFPGLRRGDGNCARIRLTLLDAEATISFAAFLHG